MHKPDVTMTKLHAACIVGQLAEAQRMLADIRLFEGEPAVEHAVASADRMGCTAFHYAAKCGSVELLRWLHAACGADALAATQSGGETALHLAAEQGHRDAVVALLELGLLASRARRSDGATALHLAARRGHGDVVDALAARGEVERGLSLIHI